MVNFDEIRQSATEKMKDAREQASGHLEKAKFTMMRRSEEEADEEASETSSRMDEFTETYCPQLTFQQVSCYIASGASW
jgi:ElaB/YqjD/DUF883 family membrane-anchored ribosome-binding protein